MYEFIYRKIINVLTNVFYTLKRKYVRTRITFRKHHVTRIFVSCNFPSLMFFVKMDRSNDRQRGKKNCDDLDTDHKIQTSFDLPAIL